MVPWAIVTEPCVEVYRWLPQIVVGKLEKSVQAVPLVSSSLSHSLQLYSVNPSIATVQAPSVVCKHDNIISSTVLDPQSATMSQSCSIKKLDKTQTKLRRFTSNIY